MSNVGITSIEAGYAVQEALRNAQGIPVFGPLVVSPFRLLVSLVQTVAGAVFALIFYAFSRVLNNDFLSNSRNSAYKAPTGLAAFFNDRTNQAYGHVVVGISSMIESVSNTFSGGRVGFEQEKERQRLPI